MDCPHDNKTQVQLNVGDNVSWMSLQSKHGMTQNVSCAGVIMRLYGKQNQFAQVRIDATTTVHVLVEMLTQVEAYHATH